MWPNLKKQARDKVGEGQDDASILSPICYVALQLLFVYQILLTIIVWNRMETASYRMCNLRHNANRL